MTAAPGPQQPDEDQCECGHSWESEHEQKTLMGGVCLPLDDSWCPCTSFRPAAPSAQPDRVTGQGEEVCPHEDCPYDLPAGSVDCGQHEGWMT